MRPLLLWPALMACYTQNEVAKMYGNLILQEPPYRQQTVFFYCISSPLGLSVEDARLCTVCSRHHRSQYLFTPGCLTNIRLRGDTLLVSLMTGPNCK